MKKVILVVMMSVTVFTSLAVAQDEGTVGIVAGISAGSMAVDSGGNIYVISDHRIRKISNGVITTIAGKGLRPDGLGAFSGDGGPAIQAEFYNPAGIAVDGKGNIYVADQSNNRIRRITPDGIISTFAGSGPDVDHRPTVTFSGDGGLATQARLSYPSDVAVDSKGNVFIADTWNHRIRRVDPNGVIMTFVGSGPVGADSTGASLGGFGGDGGLATQARLNLPKSVTVDTIGNIYLAGTDPYRNDTVNHRIRKVDKSGIISTFAGVGVPSNLASYFIGEGGPAIQAHLQNPSAIAVDSKSNVFFLDGNYGGLVAKVNSNGIIYTVAMRWSLGFETSTRGYPFIPMPADFSIDFSPSGLAVDANGLVYVSCSKTNRIYRIKPWGDQIASSVRSFVVKPWKGDTPGSIVLDPLPSTTPPPPTSTQPPPSSGTVGLDFTVTNTTGQLNPDQGGFTVRFTLKLTNQPPLRSFKWDFGDGTTSKEPHPEHTYTAAGVYNITVTITTEAGEVIIKTKEKFITVTERPQPPPDTPRPLMLIVTATPLLFGEVVLGTSKVDTIRIINRGEGKLVLFVDSLSTGPDFVVSVLNMNLGSGETARIPVIFQPRTSGPKTASLLLIHNDTHWSNPLRLTMRGAGIDPKPSPDFNGDGWVDFDDFFLFANAFGKKNVFNSTDDKFDLDRDGQIGFGDFFIFANSFGKEVKK